MTRLPPNRARQTPDKLLEFLQKVDHPALKLPALF